MTKTETRSSNTLRNADDGWSKTQQSLVTLPQPAAWIPTFNYPYCARLFLPPVCACSRHHVPVFMHFHSLRQVSVCWRRRSRCKQEGADEIPSFSKRASNLSAIVCQQDATITNLKVKYSKSNADILRQARELDIFWVNLGLGEHYKPF